MHWIFQVYLLPPPQPPSQKKKNQNKTNKQKKTLKGRDLYLGAFISRGLNSSLAACKDSCKQLFQGHGVNEKISLIPFRVVSS